jgi:hypothetical protein
MYSAASGWVANVIIGPSHSKRPMPRQRGTGKKPAPAEAGIEEEEVEMDESLDDDTFIEEQEEEDADVTDIIGGDIENREGPAREPRRHQHDAPRTSAQCPV